MSRFPIYGDQAGIAALGLLTAMSLSRRTHKRYVPSQAVIDEAHEKALREDWNRTVEARKAAKRAAKRQHQLTVMADGLNEYRAAYNHSSAARDVL